MRFLASDGGAGACPNLAKVKSCDQKAIQLERVDRSIIDLFLRLLPFLLINFFREREGKREQERDNLKQRES